MDRYCLIRSRLCIQSIRQVMRRAGSIFYRYGLDSRRFVQSLNDFIDLMDQFEIVPSFPLTASVLNRHPRLFRGIQERGVELAVHGYLHIDYTKLSLEDVNTHLHHARNIFLRHGVEHTGHRFPYLRACDSRIDAVEQADLLWDSSEVVSWNSLNRTLFKPDAWKCYQNILKTYKASDSDSFTVLPYFRNGMVEIPVSVPDDDILIERLRLREPDLMYKIMKRMVDRIRERGEILVLQLHPERYSFFKNALSRTLRWVRRHDDVWTARMHDVADWWRRRSTFSFDVKEVSDGLYRISANCDEDATILQQGDKFQKGDSAWGDADIVKRRVWDIQSPVKPIIGVHPQGSSEVETLLKAEGYAFEKSNHKEAYSLFLEYQNDVTEKDRAEIRARAADARHPLIRYWRWPNAKHYCLSITGDIDAVDIMDFVGRFNG